MAIIVSSFMQNNDISTAFLCKGISKEQAILIKELPDLFLQKVNKLYISDKHDIDLSFSRWKGIIAVVESKYTYRVIGKTFNTSPLLFFPEVSVDC